MINLNKMKSQEKDERFVDLDEISKDQELNDLWNKFCEYEELGRLLLADY